MVLINIEYCNGCGICIDTCPTGAIFLQNEKAFIDTNLCEGREVCMETCPQGAIIHPASVPVQEKATPFPIEMPTEVISIQDQQRFLAIHSEALPVIGSILLWTGRELAPRLLNLAVDYVERRIQHAETGLSRYPSQDRQRFLSQAGGRRRRQRQRRRKDYQVNERR